MESSGGKKEVEVSAPENVGEVAFGAVEVEPRSEGMVEVPIAQKREMTLVALPPTSQNYEAEKETEIEEYIPEVDKNSEQISKELVKHTMRIMRKYRKEPHEQTEAMTDFKWEYIWKRFDRHLGDGLDGRKAA